MYKGQTDACKYSIVKVLESIIIRQVLLNKAEQVCVT